MRVERNDRASAGSRVTTLLLCSLAGLAAMGAGTAAFSQTPAPSQTPPVVRVESGELQGVVDDGVASFKGIPFAAPPVGDLRWRPPQPAAPWTGVRQAAEFGADCMQGRFGPPPAPGAPPARAAVGGLPVPERLAPRERHVRGEAARDGLDSRGRIHGRLVVPARSRRGSSSPSRASSSSASTTAWGASASSRSPRSAASALTRPRATTPTWTRSRPCSG